MRRWWAGPGRNWLVVIFCSGMMTTILETMIFTLQPPAFWRIVMGQVAFAAETGFFAATALSSMLLVNLLARSYWPLVRETTLPNQVQRARRCLDASLLSCWPFMACCILAMLLRQFIYYLFISSAAHPAVGILRDAMEVVAILAPAILAILAFAACRFLAEAERWSWLLAILMLSYLPMQLARGLFGIGGDLGQIYTEGGAMLRPGLVSSCLSIILLFLVIRESCNAGSRFHLFCNGCLAAIILLVRITEVLMQQSYAPEDRLHMLFLSGFAAVTSEAPFTYVEYLQLSPNMSEWRGYIELFWNDDLMLHVQHGDPMLSAVFNLAWLISIFLVLRYLVGRHSLRPDC
ncbi:hypothetical protein KDL44_07440 [bacterium]|nr:hypothetical protein [bacterium]